MRQVSVYLTWYKYKPVKAAGMPAIGVFVINRCVMAIGKKSAKHYGSNILYTKFCNRESLFPGVIFSVIKWRQQGLYYHFYS